MQEKDRSVMSGWQCTQNLGAGERAESDCFLCSPEISSEIMKVTVSLL